MTQVTRSLILTMICTFVHNRVLFMSWQELRAVFGVSAERTSGNKEASLPVLFFLNGESCLADRLLFLASYSLTHVPPSSLARRLVSWLQDKYLFDVCNLHLLKSIFFSPPFQFYSPGGSRSVLDVPD